jgi:hypothetical protein
VAFNLNVLKGFIPIFSLYANSVTKEMQKHLDGKEFDILYPLAQLTARSVAGKQFHFHFEGQVQRCSIYSYNTECARRRSVVV